MSAVDPASDRRRRLATSGAACLLVLAGALVYGNSLSGPFIFDDLQNIVNDRSLRALWPPWRSLVGTSRPVLALSFAGNYALGGLDVTGYHLVNVVIHVLAGLVLFGLARRTFALDERRAPRAPGLAFAVALLWLVHPLATQAVTYVVQRGESLMGLFYLLTLYGVARSAAGGRAWGALAVLACALGMGTKQVAVTAPLVALLYDRTFLAGSFSAALGRRAGVYLGLGATWSVLLATMGVEGLVRGGHSAGFGLESVTPLEYARTQPGVILHYLRLVVWPHPLVLDYGWPVAAGGREVAVSAAALGVLGLATLWALCFLPRIGFLGAAFFLVLAPTSSIMPIEDLAFEHRMYLPLAAVIAAIVVAADALLARAPLGPGARRRTAAVLLGVVAAALGAATVRRNADYASAAAIWRTVVRAAPGNPRGHANLGVALLGEDRAAAAEGPLREAVRLDPDYAFAETNLGVALERQNRIAEAVAAHERALAIDPHDAEAHYNLGFALQREGRLVEAAAAFERARAADPGDAKVHFALGVVHVKQGEIDRGAADFERALHLAPGHVGARANLAAVFMRRGDLERAAAELERVIALDPDHAEAHGNLGIVLARQGDLAGAAAHLRRALTIQPDQAEAHSNLGVVLLQQGRLAEAAAEFERALAIRPAYPDARRNLDYVRTRLATEAGTNR